MTQKLLFLSHKISDPRGPYYQEQHVRDAEAIAVHLYQMGYAVYFPGGNSRNMTGAVPREVFIKADLTMLARCDAIVMAPNWYSSLGAKGELEEAKRLGLPVYYYVKGAVFPLLQENNNNEVDTGDHGMNTEALNDRGFDGVVVEQKTTTWTSATPSAVKNSSSSSGWSTAFASEPKADEKLPTFVDGHNRHLYQVCYEGVPIKNLCAASVETGHYTTYVVDREGRCVFKNGEYETKHHCCDRLTIERIKT